MTEQQPPLVVHIIYALGTGGLENGLVHVINGTPQERYRHAVVCLTRAEPFARRIRQPGVQVYQLGMDENGKLSAYWQLLKLLWRLRPAIVHSRNLAPLEAQLVTLLAPGIKRVHGEHGRDVSDLDGSNWKYRAFRRALRIFIRRYIAVSQDLARWLVDAIAVPPARVRQIYNGVDLRRFNPEVDALAATDLPAGFPSTPERVVVGTVGRLAEVKDQALILRATAELLRRRPHMRQRLRLVIVGEGSMREPLELLAREEGIADLLWLPGDRDDIPALLRLFDVFVLPSLGEGISNTLLEAMACGLPAIATRVGGSPELVVPGENGDLIAVGDAVALAQCLEHLIDNRQVWRDRGERARLFVKQNFSWPKAVASYLMVYDEVLGKVKAGSL